MTSVFPPRDSVVSDIQARDGNIEKLFLLCTVQGFVRHLLWILFQVSCPPTLNTLQGVLSIYLEYWIGFLFHTPWILLQVSCPPILPWIDFLFHLPWMMFQVTCPPRHLLVPWMPNQVSCSPPLTTEAGFLSIYVECWLGFLFACFLVHLLWIWTRFLAHLLWIWTGFSPTLDTKQGFSATCLENWIGFLVHLPWILIQSSCSPTLISELGFLSAYHEYRTRFSVNLPWYRTWFIVHLSRVLIQVSCRPTWTLNHVPYFSIFASEPSITWGTGPGCLSSPPLAWAEPGKGSRTKNLYFIFFDFYLGRMQKNHWLSVKTLWQGSFSFLLQRKPSWSWSKKGKIYWVWKIKGNLPNY